MRLPPTIAPLPSNWTWKSFPNLDELLFLFVFAFPKASRTGFTSTMHCLIKFDPSNEAFSVALCVRYLRQCFVASVFPAPLSPLMSMDWSLPVDSIWLYTLSEAA